MTFKILLLKGGKFLCYTVKLDIYQGGKWIFLQRFGTERLTKNNTTKTMLIYEKGTVFVNKQELLST